MVRKLKRARGQLKPQSRLAIPKAEITDPAGKKVRLPLSRSPGDWSNDSTSEKIDAGWPQGPRQPSRVRPFCLDSRSITDSQSVEGPGDSGTEVYPWPQEHLST